MKDFQPYSKSQQTRPTMEDIDLRLRVESNQEKRSPVLPDKKCKWCEKSFTPRNHTNICCSINCGISLARFRAAKKEKHEWNQRAGEIKEKITTLSDYKKDLQDEVNHIARLIDKDQPCIATNNKKGLMNGGHCYSVGSDATIRFNLHNIHIQSFQSNHFKSGDNVKYRDGLKKVYGEKYLHFVESLRATPTINLSIQDLKEKIKIARRIVRQLKQSSMVYSASERINLRNHCNAELNIYATNFAQL